MSTTTSAACPSCGGTVDMTPNNHYRPFCSRRCKLIDLGDWLDESNHIADPDGTMDPTAMTPGTYGQSRDN